MDEPFITLSSESTIDSSTPDSFDDSTTPLSTPPSYTHDISRASFHVQDLEHFAKDLQNAADRAFPNQGRSQIRYEDVSECVMSRETLDIESPFLLLMRWEDDEMNVDWELEDLDKIFLRYGFKTERWLIPKKNSHLKLMSKAINIVEEHDDKDHLVIIYYAGHAFINNSRQATWSCKSDPSYASLEWSAIQTLFEKAHFDVLLLLDCCAAASAAPTVGSAVTETIAACGFENIAPQPGRHSFTNTLIEVLEDWIDSPPFSAAMLHNKVLSVLKHERPERAQSGKRRKIECRRTPIHIVGTADPKLPSIELGRRPPLPDETPKTDPPNVRQRSSLESFAAIASKQSGYGVESLDSMTEDNFDVPRVIISLALEKENNLNSEACQKWLAACPAMVKYAKVEAVYKSFSTLLLLSIPVFIWDMLPENPACCFVGYATSPNFLRVVPGSVKSSATLASNPVEVSKESAVKAKVSACTRCQMRKFKCDGSAGGCATCHRAQAVCTYPRARERPIERKSANIIASPNMLENKDFIMRDSGHGTHSKLMLAEGPSRTNDHLKGHKKSRQGCYNCKRRKIKCQGTQPECENCTRKKIKCTYPAQQRLAGSSPTEKSTTHLLVATKKLLEIFTKCSQNQTTDAQVSDMYVRLGYEFNIACRAFTAVYIDASDLINVPEELRHLLESALSLETSVRGLEKHLPQIRDTIINLLHGSKQKNNQLQGGIPRSQDSDPYLSLSEEPSTNLYEDDHPLDWILKPGIKDKEGNGSIEEATLELALERPIGLTLNPVNLSTDVGHTVEAVFEEQAQELATVGTELKESQPAIVQAETENEHLPAYINTSKAILEDHPNESNQELSKAWEKIQELETQNKALRKEMQDLAKVSIQLGEETQERSKEISSLGSRHNVSRQSRPGPQPSSEIVNPEMLRDTTDYSQEDFSDIDDYDKKISASQAQRAAQNREAQRVFRQRKAQHLKELESKLAILETQFPVIAKENESLKRSLQQVVTKKQRLDVTSSQVEEHVSEPKLLRIAACEISHYEDAGGACSSKSIMEVKSTESRLGKADLEILREEFIKNPKPTISHKRDLAETLGVDLARINNYFQNCRAKAKFEARQRALEAQETNYDRVFGPEDLELLETHFQGNQTPTTQEECLVAEKLEVKVNRITDWFKNRRERYKFEEAMRSRSLDEDLGYSDTSSEAGSQSASDSDASESGRDDKFPLSPPASQMRKRSWTTAIDMEDDLL